MGLAGDLSGMYSQEWNHQVFVDVHAYLHKWWQIALQNGCQSPLPPQSRFIPLSNFLSLMDMFCWFFFPC